MTQPTAATTLKPALDERPLWDLIGGVLAYRAMAVSHDLKLFYFIAAAPRTVAEVCDELKIASRPATALLTTCTAVGLLTVEEGRYELTPLTRTYLLESSPYYFGAYLDLLNVNDQAWSFESVKQAVISDKPQVYGGGEVFKSDGGQAVFDRATFITHAMHSHSAGAAYAWPELIDLSDCQKILDVGGGSGIHAIAAALQWPHLQAVVYDLPPVCEVAKEYIARASLQERVKAHAGDWWNSPFPVADAHFYADIYHDWPPDKGRLLTKKSFDSLPAGGRIIIHEMLYNDEKTGPLTTAAFSLVMLLWIEGQQYSGHELEAILTEAGFTEIETKPSFGYWSIVTGRKR